MNEKMKMEAQQQQSLSILTNKTLYSDIAEASSHSLVNSQSLNYAHSLEVKENQSNNKNDEELDNYNCKECAKILVDTARIKQSHTRGFYD